MKKLITIAVVMVICSTMAVAVAPHVAMPHTSPAHVYVPSTPVKAPTPAMKTPTMAPRAIESVPMKPVTIPPAISWWPSFYPFGMHRVQCNSTKDEPCK